jgi:hypothetical protein
LANRETSFDDSSPATASAHQSAHPSYGSNPRFYDNFEIVLPQKNQPDGEKRNIKRVSLGSFEKPNASDEPRLAHLKNQMTQTSLV